MSVIDNLRRLAERARGYPRNLAERRVETYLVQPFIEALGYDRLNHDQVEMQYPIQIGSRAFPCDYAIKRDGEPIILVECKDASLSENNRGRRTQRSDQARQQLGSYFQSSPVWLGIYTTGFEYRFYSGALSAQGIKQMDVEPFLLLDLLNFDDRVAEQVSAFAKDRFDPNEVKELAQRIRDRQSVEEALRGELRSPSDGLVRLVMNRVGVEGDKFDRYKPIVHEVTREILWRDQATVAAATPTPINPARVARSSSATSQDERIVSLREQGLSFAAIGARVGLPHYKVRNALIRLGKHVNAPRTQATATLASSEPSVAAIPATQPDSRNIPILGKHKGTEHHAVLQPDGLCAWRATARLSRRRERPSPLQGAQSTVGRFGSTRTNKPDAGNQYPTSRTPLR